MPDAPSQASDPQGARSRRPAGSLLRSVLWGICLGLVATTVATALGWVPPSENPRLAWIFAAGASVGVATGWWSAARGSSRARWLDVLAWNALIALLAGEVALRVLQRVAPSQILWDDASAAGRIVVLRRCEPGLWFHYRCNAQGYPDEDFFEPGPDDYSVALFADSFGVGSVPWEYHFATLAEQELRERLGARHARVAIDNRSVIGIGPREYRYLFESEVRGHAYRQVVVCFFVGNDLEPEQRSERSPWRLARLQGWLPFEVARRAWLIGRGVERLRPPDEARETEPAFLRDPDLEPPYFTPEAFLFLEEAQTLATMKGTPRVEILYDNALKILEGMHEELGTRFLLVVIPDEFQVNDALWEEAVGGAVRRSGLPRTTFDRDYPQRRIQRWAAERGVRVLDLLPALRAAERESRTYHLRDTHWNAHGNRVAGRELARALLAYAEATDAPLDPSAALSAPGRGTP